MADIFILEDDGPRLLGQATVIDIKQAPIDMSKFGVIDLGPRSGEVSFSVPLQVDHVAIMRALFAGVHRWRQRYPHLAANLRRSRTAGAMRRRQGRALRTITRLISQELAPLVGQKWGTDAT